MSGLKRLALGSIAGALATAPMTAVFWMARRAALLDEVPPHKAVRSVAPAQPEPRLSWLSALAHLSIGAGAGAMYSTALPRRFQNPGTGALFGVAVWVVGYEGVMPAATDIEPAHRDARARALTILVAHIIYGATLGLLSYRTKD